MSRYRIVSEGGKFYIQYLKRVGWFRKRLAWRYVMRSCYAGVDGGETADIFPYDTLELAELDLTRLIKQHENEGKPFGVVKEV